MTQLNTEKSSQTTCAKNECQKASANTVRNIRPRYRILDTDDSYRVEIDIPGVNKSGVAITLEDGVLDVTASRTWKAPENWKTLGRSENASFRLRLAIGDEVNAEGIEAAVSNGVLDLKLSKVEEVKPRKIKVT